MFGQSDSEDYQPFGHLGTVPLYVTTILIMVCSVAMVVLALLSAANSTQADYFLAYDGAAILHGFQFWRFFTYPLLNGPSIWFAVDMVMLYLFGRDVERFIGRRAFIVLCLTLLLAVPCVLTTMAPWLPSVYGGVGELNFGIFVAFVAIYANVEILFTIKAKWIALVLGVLAILQCLAARDWVRLIAFVTACATGWIFIKQLRGQIELRLPGRDFFRRRRSRRSLRVVPGPGRPAAPPRKAARPQEDVIESIDPLLDKIAKSGLASLTAREREKLEKARAELLKKSTD